jgi:TaqI-like C-terminal specificity domain
VSEGHFLEEVVHFGHEQVFTGASTYTCLLFLNKAGEKQFRFIMVSDLLEWRVKREAVEGNLPSEVVTPDDWNFVVGRGADLFTRMSQTTLKLGNITDRIFQGIKTSADKIYIVEGLKFAEDLVKVYSREKDAEYWLEVELLHPLIKGGDSRRYNLSRTKRLILFPYTLHDEADTALIPASDLSRRFPYTWEYLLDNKPYLESREHGRMRGSTWYAYGRTQALDVMPLPKIFTPDIALRPSFSLDESGEVFFTGGVAGGYGILVKPDYSREYILGLLNSSLLEWILRQTTTFMRGGYLSFESRYIRGLPILTLDGTDSTRKALHDDIVALVEQMIELHQRLSAARSSTDRNFLQRQINATDHQIDRVVYELYGLTDEEVEIVEELRKKR